jgi:phosphoribosylamine-glycine ligase
MSIRILLLGSGGREHAIAWKLSQSPLLDHLYVCPGNVGTSKEPKTSNLSNISPDDFPNLVQFALETCSTFSILLFWPIFISLHPRFTLLFLDLSNR